MPSVGAPHDLEYRCASDAQSVNDRRKVVDRRLICERSQTSLRSTTTDLGPHGLYGWGQLGFWPQTGRKQTARRTYALCDQGLSDPYLSPGHIRLRPPYGWLIACVQSAVNRSHASSQRSFICGHIRISRAAGLEKFYNHGNV